MWLNKSLSIFGLINPVPLVAADEVEGSNWFGSPHGSSFHSFTKPLKNFLNFKLFFPQFTACTSSTLAAQLGQEWRLGPSAPLPRSMCVFGPNLCSSPATDWDGRTEGSWAIVNPPVRPMRLGRLHQTGLAQCCRKTWTCGFDCADATRRPCEGTKAIRFGFSFLSKKTQQTSKQMSTSVCSHSKQVA